MTININPTSMAEYVNAEFYVLDDPSNSLRLKLTGIVEHVKNESQETFSIFFHGPPTMFMQQGLRHLKNESLGEVSMFLVPVGQDADGFQYEAVFNHTIR
jgi:hypothetical protein